jgi:hypothetical protein
LAIRSTASDCHLTDTYDLYGRDHSLTNHTRNRALQSLSFSPPNQSQIPLYPGTHEQHNYGRRPVLVLLTPAKSLSRPASLESRNSIHFFVREPGQRIAVSTGTNICLSTRQERVSVRKAAWWLQMSNLKALALLLRFDARSSASRLRQMPPRTPDRFPMDLGQGILRGTPTGYCNFMSHEAHSFSSQSSAVEPNSVTLSERWERELSQLSS